MNEKVKHSGADSEGKDTRIKPRVEPPEKHMGAKESEVQGTKPPTQELAEMMDKKGQASPPEKDKFNPSDEITPG